MGVCRSHCCRGHCCWRTYVDCQTDSEFCCGGEEGGGGGLDAVEGQTASSHQESNVCCESSHPRAYNEGNMLFSCPLLSPFLSLRQIFKLAVARTAHTHALENRETEREREREDWRLRPQSAYPNTPPLSSGECSQPRSRVTDRTEDFTRKDHFDIFSAQSGGC